MPEVWETADFVGTQWLAIGLDESDVHEHEEVGLDRLLATAREEMSEDGEVPQNGDLVLEALELLLDEAAHDHGFVVIHDDCGLDFTLREDRHRHDERHGASIDDLRRIVGAVISDEVGD